MLAPDGVSWLFGFHHLPLAEGLNTRRAFMAPLTFVDRHDGRGDVWVQPILVHVNNSRVVVASPPAAVGR